MNRTFVVLGSNSFSGSHFVNYCLESGDEVIGISRSKEPNDIFLPYRKSKGLEVSDHSKKFKFCQLDLNKDTSSIIDIIDLNEAEYVVNFASQGMVAQSWKQPVDWYQTNLIGQVALHEKLRQISTIKKYVHITTPEVYGSTNGKWVRENAPFKPSTPYAVSRASCDLHLQSFYEAYDFPVVYTRAANVYGAGQQLYRVIPRAFLSALCHSEFCLDLNHLIMM